MAKRRAGFRVLGLGVMTWKMVSMQRAEMLSQSMNPRAYAMGSHMRSIEPREPPNLWRFRLSLVEPPEPPNMWSFSV